MNPARITRRGAVAAFAAAFAAPAVALQSPADATALRLWAERQAAVDRLRAASDAYSKVSAELPAWAQSGPRLIDHEGKPCGTITAWPLDETVKPPDAGRRVCRPSPDDCQENFAFAVRTFHLTGKARRKARDHMRRRIAAINARVSKRAQLYVKMGLTELSRLEDVACADIGTAEAFFLTSADTSPNVMAARLLIGVCDHSGQDDRAIGNGYCGTMALALIALTPMLPNLTGLIRDHAAFFVANPETPLGSMPFAPV